MSKFCFLVSLLASGLLSSCVYGPVTPNVRVCNVTPLNIRVESVGEDGTPKVQTVIPGGMALDYAPAMTVHGPKVTTRVTAALSEVSDGSGGFKYGHMVKRGVGHHDVIFKVLVDEEGLAWANSVDGRRVRFPSQIIGRAAQE